MPGGGAASAERRPCAGRGGHAPSGRGRRRRAGRAPRCGARGVCAAVSAGGGKGLLPPPRSPLPPRYMPPPAAGAARRGISREGWMVRRRPSGAALRAHGGPRTGSLVPACAPPGSPARHRREAAAAPAPGGPRPGPAPEPRGSRREPPARPRPPSTRRQSVEAVAAGSIALRKPSRRGRRRAVGSEI